MSLDQQLAFVIEGVIARIYIVEACQCCVFPILCHTSVAVFQKGDRWRTRTTAGTSRCRRCSTTWSTSYWCAPCGVYAKQGTRPHCRTADWSIIAARTREVVSIRREDAYSRNCSRPVRRRAATSSNSRSPNEARAL